MALSESSLGAAIKSAIESAYGPASDPSQLQKFADALAQAIVRHLKSQGQVFGTVTSGPGSGGDVIGTIL